MRPTRSTRPQRIIAMIKPVLAVLGGLTMLYVCVKQLYFETFEVDPAAASEVRDIGKVLAHTKQEFLLWRSGPLRTDHRDLRPRGTAGSRGASPERSPAKPVMRVSVSP